MADVFGEVDEQIRSLRVETIIRQGWPFAAAAAGALIIGAVGLWGWSQHEASEDAHASVLYQGALDELAKGQKPQADRDFAAVAASAPPGYRALALMQQAQARLDANRTNEAVRLMDQAAKIAPDTILGDAARLKAALAVMDEGDGKAAESRLTQLTGAKAPFRALALEALAMARLQVGDVKQARSDFQVLTLSQDVSQSAQARAHAALDLIQSGSASALAAAAKSAAALPPQPTPTQPARNVQ